MQYLSLGPEKSTYKLAILVTTIQKDLALKYYIEPYGINLDEVILIKVHQRGKKTPMKEMRTWIEEELVGVLNDIKIEHLLIANAEYYKAFTKTTNAERTIGYKTESTYGNWNIFYVPDYRAVFYDPELVKSKIDISFKALLDTLNNKYQAPGIDIIKFSEYPETLEDIANWLQKLIDMDCNLTCDIEGFSLKHYNSGIGTISFAWSKTEGIAIPVDILNDPERSLIIKKMLRIFFENFKHTMIYHNIAFDVMILIYELFMDNLLDTEGLLTGMDVMLRDWHCTKLISYLATNSCAGNNLSLKDQAQEYAGNYAVDEITDIRKIPLPKLLEYNLIDTLSTWYTFDKNYPILVQDDQLDFYNNIFKPAILDIIQMQLTGMPIDMDAVIEAKRVLQEGQDQALDKLSKSSIISEYTYLLNEKWVIEKNNKLKKKRVTLADAKEVFNPNSGPQLIELLYELLALPILDYTDTRLPATGNDTLKKLLNHTDREDVKELLQALMDYKTGNKLLTSFIPALENAQLGPDGWYYLFGNFNLGGTVSGRLSSSDPNLQNLPAAAEGEKTLKGRYGKLIKACFKAPPGWIFCGLDFASLEDRISALTTKDPNKLKVYTDGYDGHCLRAYAYFGDSMPDINPLSVDSINSIAEKYKPLRAKSKNPTFALTYQGTFKTLMTNYNFSEELAKKCELAYNTLYKVSVDWVNDKLDQACKTGYVIGAFGLRIRTPLLKQVIRGTKKTPQAAEAEGRTAGNALGQSWCLLNNRASSAFMNKVRKSQYRLDIRPIAQIHDAQYYLIRDDIDILMYSNKHLAEEVNWNNHPDIYHPEVGLGGELSVFYPNWGYEVSLPNDATEEEIFSKINTHIEKLNAS